MRSRSSWMALSVKASCTVGASVHSLSNSRPSSGAKVRAVRSRLKTSSARFLAVAISQAEGLSGTPRHFQTSAEGVLDNVFRQGEVVYSENPRQGGDHTPRLVPEKMIAGFHLHIQLHSRPYFHLAVNFEDRTTLGKLYRLIQIASFDQGVSTNSILGFGKGSIRHCLSLTR